jgi:hypothetical protein
VSQPAVSKHLRILREAGSARWRRRDDHPHPARRLGDRGKNARDAAGWHVCLDNLDAHLRGGEPDRQSETWRSLNAEYVERIGPEAATIDPPEELVERK